MYWRAKYEREVKEARENLRKVWARLPRLAFLARAVEESGVEEYTRGIEAGDWGDWIRLDVADFALVEPLRKWLSDHGYPPDGSPATHDTFKSFYHGRIYVQAFPPQEDDEGAAPCRYVQVGDEWVPPKTTEGYHRPVYKIVCDDEMQQQEGGGDE